MKNYGVTLATKRKIDPLNVKNIEEEIILIKGAEEDYNKNWWRDAREVYLDGLKYIDNLKK